MPGYCVFCEIVAGKERADILYEDDEAIVFRNRLRWVPVMLAGLVLQVGIFSETIGRAAGDAGPAIYVLSAGLVFAAVLRNIRVPGIAIIAIGAGCNLAAIVANGGWMPADPGALASIGGLPPGYTNSILITEPTLRPLTDLFALPTWLPLSNVFSLGDVLIGIGVAATIALAMRGPRPAARPGRWP
jgi:hypothetical protein